MITYTVGVNWDGTGYTDESAYVASGSIRRGREYGWDDSGRAPMRYGEATLTLNNDTRRFDPNYAAGALYAYLMPGKQIRVTETENGITRPAFTGWIKDLRPTGYRGHLATVSAVDGLYWLGQQNCTSVGTTPNYKVTSALYDLAAMSAWPVIGSSTFPFTFPLTLSILGLEDNGDLITSWSTDTSETILATMQEIEKAFCGTVYVGADGNLRYKTRSTGAPENFIITDSDVMDTELRMPWDVIYNSISVTGTAGAAQVQSNSTSITTYGKRNMTVGGNSYIQSAAEALKVSRHLIIVAKDRRFELNILTRAGSAIQFGADLMDTVHYIGALSDIDTIFFVGGVKHEFQPAGNTITTLYLEQSQYEYSGLQKFTFTFPLTLGW